MEPDRKCERKGRAPVGVVHSEMSFMDAGGPGLFLRFSCGSSDTLSPGPSKSLERHSAKEKAMFLCVPHSLEHGREKQWFGGRGGRDQRQWGP